MLDKTKPDLLMVTTVDGYHSEYIVKGLDRGIDVMTEKPMVIDETQCQAVLDAEKRTGRNIIVTFNYRYAPKHQKMKEILMAGEIGKVDVGRFHLVPRHAPRRRLLPPLAPPARRSSGSLWVHKATHHFDLDQLVARRRSGRRLGVRQPAGLRQERPVPRPPTAGRARTRRKCRYHYDMTKDKTPMRPLRRCEVADGYYSRRLRLQGGHRHLRHDERGGEVLERRHDELLAERVHADRRATGWRSTARRAGSRCATTSGSRGSPSEETEISRDQELRPADEDRDARIGRGGHGGGDTILRDLVFRKADGARAPATARLARRRHVVPDRHRRSQEHRRESADPDCRPREAHLTRDSP